MRRRRALRAGQIHGAIHAQIRPVRALGASTSCAFQASKCCIQHGLGTLLAFRSAGCQVDDREADCKGVEEVAVHLRGWNVHRLQRRSGALGDAVCELAEQLTQRWLMIGSLRSAGA